ncbi:endonuclease/exonuclease/phosphatase family protein [Streptomyces sp. SBST2-5]|uniref:Endonuclease/exonuclease/phosphatase family protein n=1 Tax=Streptomyces composti TaxID=2720025 RepID=A0ABX1A3W0_9ACTN|nr:endonuclease/exonuclease/phosphatase family protein [Streptomyces composti]NJP51123.1 endonuclease/exonuclease/phosphatase family protein [Streptomyces composti]
MRAKTSFATLLLAPTTALLACRLADTDALTPVPQLLAFLPWLLAPVAVALLLSVLARWWPGTVWGVVLLGLLAWYIEPYGKSPDPTGRPLVSLRVLTSNVEFGRATPALVDAVRRHTPDLVFVQECDDTCDAALQKELATAYPHRAADIGGGSEGSVILSRHPLRPTPGVEATMGMPGAIADIDGHDVRLQLAHPMPPVPGQTALWQRELARLRDLAAADRTIPTVMAGDFNASQDHAAFRALLDTGLYDAARLTGQDRTPTWPSHTTPAFGAQIDHVLVTDDFTATRTRFLDLPDTDHRALLTDLTLHATR